MRVLYPELVYGAIASSGKCYTNPVGRARFEDR